MNWKNDKMAQGSSFGHVCTIVMIIYTEIIILKYSNLFFVYFFENKEKLLSTFNCSSTSHGVFDFESFFPLAVFHLILFSPYLKINFFFHLPLRFFWDIQITHDTTRVCATASIFKYHSGELV